MPGDSIRELLDANITAAEAPAATVGAPSAPVVTATPAPPGPVVTPEGTTPAPGTPPVASTPAAPAPGAPPAAAPEADPTKAAVDDKTKHNLSTVIVHKAPGTWTPAAREHWNSLPEGVRDEVIKREREVSRAMTQSSSARKFVGEFNQIIAPHIAQIQAEGGNPLSTIQGMFNVGTMLRTGAPQSKAELLANLCKQFGVDLEMLDQSLDKVYNGAGGQSQRQPQGVDPAHLQRLVNQAVAPVLQPLVQNQRQLLQQIEQEVDGELSDFASKHEFYEDVKQDMADIVEMANRRGMNMTLTEAYERATLLSAPVRAVMEQRKAASASQQAHAVAQQAKAGAFGITPSANTGVTNLPAGDSIRDCLERSMTHHSGRVN